MTKGDFAIGLFWRGLTVFWTVLTIVLFSINFLWPDRFDLTATSIGTLYIGILSIFAGTKEYIRWRVGHISRYRGELYVLVWSIALAIFVITAFVNPSKFTVEYSLVAVYIAVLTIFALTRHSKLLYKTKTK